MICPDVERKHLCLVDESAGQIQYDFLDHTFVYTAS